MENKHKCSEICKLIYRIWGDSEPIIENKKSELDILLEEEKQQPTANATKEKKYSALAIFEIDINTLYKKNEKTYYSPASHMWKDGIVFKFSRGIPERGQPCIAIFKYDIRNKYHDFIAGCPRTTGRGMPYSLGKYEKGELHYGIRPVIHIYPAIQDVNREPIRYRLILANWQIRNTSRGGSSSGSLQDWDHGKVIYQITGADTSASGNHGNIWICAVVEGSPRKRIIRVANDTCNIREFVENI